MPKLIYDRFLRELRIDISTNCNLGEKYITVREIAEKFSVSLQTAQKAIKELSKENLITSKPKAGIIRTGLFCKDVDLTRKKVFVISNRQDGHFFHSYYDRIKSVCDTYGIKSEFQLNTFPDATSYDYGVYLASLDADGLIMLSFPDSELAFYHAMREGKDIISDIILDKLPILPAVQTDNYRHSYSAGMKLVEEECTEFYVFGYFTQENKRFKGFSDAVATSGFKAKYFELSSMSSIAQIAEIIRNSRDDIGIFISDYSSSYVIDSLCARENTIPKHILVYDTDKDYFEGSFLPPVKAVAPSLNTLGKSLCNMLIKKWINGVYPEKRQIKI